MVTATVRRRCGGWWVSWREPQFTHGRFFATSGEVECWAFTHSVRLSWVDRPGE